jgi:hypothetical protein
MIARAGREKFLKKEFISHDKLTINLRVGFKKLKFKYKNLFRQI